MSIRNYAVVATVAAAAVAAWAITSYVSSSPEQDVNQVRLRQTPTAPPEILKRNKGPTKSNFNGPGPHKYKSENVSPINLADVPRVSASPSASTDYVVGGSRVDSKFSDEQVAAALAAAAAQATSAAVQNIDGSQKPVGFKPKGGVQFNAIDAADCCTNSGFSATVPPDIDMAAGPDHLIVVVNIAFEIYDKKGKSLTGGPLSFAQFFDGTAGCTAFDDDGFAGVFDPDVVYDTVHDRFVLGIDGNGTDFCVAASQSGDPTGMWNRYGFATNIKGAFFDFPHMGVGEEAIFMGSNQFGAPPFGFEGRIFAMDKAAMYAGTPMAVVTREVTPPGQEGVNNGRLDGTPQPSQQQPIGTPFYIMTEFFDGKVHSVYSWDDPFGADIWVHEGDVDLAAGSGVPCEGQSCFPISWPQKGSVEILAGNDFRGQETEFRNGYLWTTQTVSCNPGKGTRNCVRWAQIDPAAVGPGQEIPIPGFPPFVNVVAGTNGVIQAGVFGSDWDYRSFPSIAANNCNDMAVGYSYGKAPGNSGGTWYPSIFVTGRQSSDALGYVGGERLLKKAKEDYSSFQDNGGTGPERWGDYTGMTLDPNGKTFWYAGQYAGGDPAVSIISGNDLANWGTYVGSFEFPGCN